MLYTCKMPYLIFGTIGIFGCTNTDIPTYEHIRIEITEHSWNENDELTINYVISNLSERTICVAIHPGIRDEDPGAFFIRDREGGRRITGLQPGDPWVSIAPQPNSRADVPTLFETIEAGETIERSMSEGGYYHLISSITYQLEIFVLGIIYCDNATTVGVIDEGLVRLTGMTVNPYSSSYRSEVYVVD